jgi:hypothetical protein
MLRLSLFVLMFGLALTSMASAQQPTSPDVPEQCAIKYDAAKAAGTIGSISREDFLKACAVTTGAGLRVTASKAKKPLPPEVQSDITEAIKSCGQKVKFTNGFVTRLDINGDGIDDFTLDYGHFLCGESSTSDYCGTGGCTTRVFVSRSDGKFAKVLDDIVRAITFTKKHGRPAMMLALHGSACGRAGYEPCSVTLYWNGETFSHANGVEPEASQQSVQNSPVPPSVAAPKSARPAVPTETEVIGSWEYISTTNSLTDQIRYTAALKSIDGKYTLTIKCDEPPLNSIYPMLLAPIYLGKGTSSLRTIKYRFDSGPVIQEEWHFDQSYAANLNDHVQAKNFALNLMHSSRLVMEALYMGFF